MIIKDKRQGGSMTFEEFRDGLSMVIANTKDVEDLCEKLHEIGARLNKHINSLKGFSR